nr:hypothetical protein [uncultured Pseudomonas sp.]
MPTLTKDQLDNANLALIHQVFVQEGRLQDGQEILLWELHFASMPIAVKQGRKADLQLFVVADRVDDGLLDEIKQKLLTNSTLAESHQQILAATWRKRPMMAAQIP